MEKIGTLAKLSVTLFTLACLLVPSVGLSKVAAFKKPSSSQKVNQTSFAVEVHDNFCKIDKVYGTTTEQCDIVIESGSETVILECLCTYEFTGKSDGALGCEVRKVLSGKPECNVSSDSPTIPETETPE